MATHMCLVELSLACALWRSTFILLYTVALSVHNRFFAWYNMRARGKVSGPSVTVDE